MKHDSRASKLRVDERLLDTRPIWELALAEIGNLRTANEQVNTRLDQLRAGQDQLRTELRDEMRVGYHKLERQLMRRSRDFLEFRAEHDMLEDRIEKLEPQPN